MNRREFLAATATLAAAAGTEVAHNAAAAAAAPGPRLIVLIPPLRAEQIAELKAVAPEVELIVCKDNSAALEHASEAHASLGFITAEMIRAGTNLRWVQQTSAGVEGVLAIPELVERPITLTNMQRTYGPEIADQAIGYLLCFTRSLGHFIQAKSREEWHTPRELVLDELDGKTMLVIGLGGIGSHVARRAAGFGMQVIATDPKVLERPPFVAELHRPDALLQLVPRADVVTIAAPLTPATEKLVALASLPSCAREPSSSTWRGARLSIHRPWWPPCSRDSSPPRALTSPTPSRCRPAIRCGNKT